MGLIHLDAGVVIGLLDGNDPHHAAARGELTAALANGDRLAMAASAFAECLVGPMRSGGSAVGLVRELFQRVPIDIVDLDAGTAERAARLRASHRALRLPDALVIASADLGGADELVTTDRRWPTARVLKLGYSIKRL